MGNDVERWSPQPSPRFEGPYALNHALDEVERWEIAGAAGPEDVAIDDEGRLVTGVADGRVIRFPPGGGVPEVVADTYGRPLGVEVLDDHTYLVVDAYRGLLAVTATGRVRTLVNTVEGRRLVCANNATVASDGTIYLTDSSDRYPLDRYRRDVIEHRAGGRVCRYDPGSGVAEVVASGLHFANGVALAEDGAVLVVAETSSYRLLRIPLGGPAAGEPQVLIDALPGFPDNVTVDDDGIIWVACPEVRNPLLDRLAPFPRVRRAVARTPEWSHPTGPDRSLVIGVDPDGRVVHCLHGPAGRYTWVTGVRAHGGSLYLGSLVESAVGRIPRPGAR